VCDFPARVIKYLLCKYFKEGLPSKARRRRRLHPARRSNAAMEFQNRAITSVALSPEKRRHRISKRAINSGISDRFKRSTAVSRFKSVTNIYLSLRLFEVAAHTTNVVVKVNLCGAVNKFSGALLVTSYVGNPARKLIA
jgi:hypothetical protein